MVDPRLVWVVLIVLTRVEMESFKDHELKDRERLCWRIIVKVVLWSAQILANQVGTMHACIYKAKFDLLVPRLKICIDKS